MRTSSIKNITKCAELLNRYQPFSSFDQEFIDGLEVDLQGDTPNFKYQRAIGHTWSGEQRPGKAFMLEFKYPKTREEHVQNLIYTPHGTGWLRGSMYEKFSIYNPRAYMQTLHKRQILPKGGLSCKKAEFSALLNLFKKPEIKDIEVLSTGTIVDVGSRLHTYGDWVLKYLAILTSVSLSPPLVIPYFLMTNSYIKRDLKILDIEVKVIHKPVLIKNALVAHETRPFLYWTSSEVDNYRKSFGIKTVNPRKSSILYLSRLGIKSNATLQGQRDYPSQIVAEIVKKLGGKVILTDEITYEEYYRLASEAETVIADHGAAMSNLLFWRSKNVIELFTNQWWDDCFLFLGKALGVENYVLLNIDNVSASELSQRINGLLESFQKQ